MIARLWWRLTDRHGDGSEHMWEPTKRRIGWHLCSGTCHHFEVACALCGLTRMFGWSVEEVR